ncbi:MAG: hydrogenase nickel incorporation protein HypB [Anaerolineae bacterium]|nr:hydrogenase nickel incorporation protein HypB [Anaerolineae bacterium]
MNSPRILEIRRSVLEKNDVLAQNLRARFTAAGVLVINLVSSPGAGKTALLEATLRHLRENGIGAAALVGDLATDNDAQRLARSGAPVRQIVTGGNCHLEADMIETHLADWGLALDSLDCLFIENVGNLVCPASYDLGEHLRVVLFSVTEGEDKPLKYPIIFNTADVAIITKIDLAAAVEFDRDAATAAIHAVHPGISILETSAKTGKGMSNWLDYLNTCRNSFALHRITP